MNVNNANSNVDLNMSQSAKKYKKYKIAGIAISVLLLFGSALTVACGFSGSFAIPVLIVGAIAPVIFVISGLAAIYFCVSIQETEKLELTINNSKEKIQRLEDEKGKLELIINNSEEKIKKLENEINELKDGGIWKLKWWTWKKK